MNFGWKIGRRNVYPGDATAGNAVKKFPILVLLEPLFPLAYFTMFLYFAPLFSGVNTKRVFWRAFGKPDFPERKGDGVISRTSFILQSGKKRPL
jgi:hypothetical protein